MKQLEVRVSTLETKKTVPTTSKPEKKVVPKKDKEEDDDIDLFGSESEVNIIDFIIKIIIHIIHI